MSRNHKNTWTNFKSEKTLHAPLRGKKRRRRKKRNSADGAAKLLLIRPGTMRSVSNILPTPGASAALTRRELAVHRLGDTHIITERTHERLAPVGCREERSEDTGRRRWRRESWMNPSLWLTRRLTWGDDWSTCRERMDQVELPLKSRVTGHECLWRFSVIQLILIWEG